MSKHTPGPWTAINTERGIPTVRSATRSICVTDWHDLAKSRADAQLIAAAPDMLEALRQIASYDPTQWDAATLGNIARAAIAKATGEQA